MAVEGDSQDVCLVLGLCGEESLARPCRSDFCRGSFYRRYSYFDGSTNTAVPYASTSVTPCMTSVAS
jgi:hypothetical protein